MKTQKTHDRWDLEVTFQGTTVRAEYRNFRAHSRLEAEVRGLSYARQMNPRSNVLKVRGTPSAKREAAEARAENQSKQLEFRGGI